MRCCLLKLEHITTCTASVCSVRQPEVREKHIRSFILPVVSPRWRKVPIELVRLLLKLEHITTCTASVCSVR